MRCDVFACRAREQFESTQRVATFGRVEAREHAFHALRFEHCLLIANSSARSGEPKRDAATVVWIGTAGDVAVAFQAIDGQGHGGCGHAHMAGEIVERGGLELVEMVEHAGLVRANDLALFVVTDVARMAGEKDARVIVHHLAHGVHGRIVF